MFDFNFILMLICLILPFDVWCILTFLNKFIYFFIIFLSYYFVFFCENFCMIFFVLKVLIVITCYSCGVPFRYFNSRLFLCVTFYLIFQSFHTPYILVFFLAISIFKKIIFLSKTLFSNMYYLHFVYTIFLFIFLLKLYISIISFILRFIETIVIFVT